MMLEAVLEFRSKCDLGGFSVLELVDKAGGGGDQTAPVVLPVRPLLSLQQEPTGTSTVTRY